MCWARKVLEWSSARAPLSRYPRIGVLVLSFLLQPLALLSFSLSLATCSDTKLFYTLGQMDRRHAHKQHSQTTCKGIIILLHLWSIYRLFRDDSTTKTSLKWQKERLHGYAIYDIFFLVHFTSLSSISLLVSILAGWCLTAFSRVACISFTNQGRCGMSLFYPLVQSLHSAAVLRSGFGFGFGRLEIHLSSSFLPFLTDTSKATKTWARRG